MSKAFEIRVAVDPHPGGRFRWWVTGTEISGFESDLQTSKAAAEKVIFDRLMEISRIYKITPSGTKESP